MTSGFTSLRSVAHGVATGSGLVSVRAAMQSNYMSFYGGGSSTTLVWREGEKVRGANGCTVVLEADEDSALADPGTTSFVPLVLRLRMERLMGVRPRLMGE